MIQGVIQNIIVFWAHLYAIPKKILHDIRRVIMNFLWNGRKDSGKYHLARWDLIMKPKSCGGWGLKDLYTFGRTLLMKSFWRGLKSTGIWNKIIKFKYPEVGDVENLFSLGWKNSKGGSTIWNGFKSCWPVFTSFLHWKFGDGGKILIGSKVLYGDEETSQCSDQLLRFLNGKGYFYICQIIKGFDGGIPYWMSEEELQLPEHLKKSGLIAQKF